MNDNRIVDVAKRAGVSVATVSRVLNNSPNVTLKTKDKVLRTVREMNYTPNALAKHLRSKRTMTLGVIVSDIEVSYYSEIIKGIENTANSLQYKIIICDSQNQRDKEREYMSLLVDRTVDGMILVTPKMTDQEIVSYVDNGFTLGLIGRYIDHPSVPCAFTDNVKLAKEVVGHLIEQGHNRIAFISGYADSVDSYERLEGYMKALRDAGLPFAPELIRNGDFNEEGGYRAFLHLWEQCPDLTAVFSANDEMALGVYRACESIGIVIPHRVAVVGVDNNRVTQYIMPKLSTVEQPKFRMGALLAEKLVDQMNDNTLADTRFFKIDSKFLIRESSLHKRM